MQLLSCSNAAVTFRENFPCFIPAYHPNRVAGTSLRLPELQEQRLKITFVNHASLFVQSTVASILCDPWAVGKAFNDGWALLSPSFKVPYESVDYIWISHEHPDHFSFPTLRSIPEADRARITVIYQKHSSPRLVEAFRKLGFRNVRELPLYRWHMLRPGLEVLCGSIGSMDSFLAIRADGECILNLNDCVCNVKQIDYIRRVVGKPSLLFTQFSFANWIGNHGDESNAVPEKLDEITYQVRTFQPEFTVPFASFIYFCNQENAWMNQLMVTPRRVLQLGLPGVNFMYPGDMWDSTVRAFRSGEAVERYAKDSANLRIDPTPAAVDDDTLRKAVTALFAKLHGKFGARVLARIQPFSIYLHDVNRVLRIEPRKASCDLLEATSEAAAGARYVMCSQAAWYAFAHTWGWNTLQVSGMFLDREFSAKGEDKLLAGCVNALSTDLLNFKSVPRALRTLAFFWGKKYELFYQYASRPIHTPAGLQQG